MKWDKKWCGGYGKISMEGVRDFVKRYCMPVWDSEIN